ncbi:uncharacterized protein saxo4 [Spinachia spinachia]
MSGRVTSASKTMDTLALPPVSQSRVSGVPEGRALHMSPSGQGNSSTGSEATPSRCAGLFSPEAASTGGAIAPMAWPPSLLLSLRPESNAPTIKSIGKKEPTGFILNAPSNLIFPNTPFDCSHFNTTYKSSFCHDGASEESVSGLIGAGSICGKRDSSYNRRDTDRFIIRG